MTRFRCAKLRAASIFHVPISCGGSGAEETDAAACMQRGSHHRLYQVVRPAVVRAGVETNSLRTERLRIGERLTILESREFGGAFRP
jgi:hypothetical protein